jgi:hypothetical protein
MGVHGGAFLELVKFSDGFENHPGTGAGIYS